MEDSVLRLLEHTAIRYSTGMDYKVWRELECTGEFCNRLPVLSDLELIRKSGSFNGLSERSRILTDDAVSSSDKVKAALERYVNLVERHNIKVVGCFDDKYPYIWRELSGMPPVIFCKGDLTILEHIDTDGSVSIVGSRKPGRYALYATGEFSSGLAMKGAVIVSGLAVGIDRRAHESCLDSGGKTLAVVPGGCDRIYPNQNRDIYQRISETGLILSELPPGQEIIKQYFPSRNRLISALSDVCLIMEAGLYSGTLHTASFAASQGKDVFVLPNSIYAENSAGGLMLIRDGAEVLIDIDTVYERVEGEVSNRLQRMGKSKKDSIDDLRNTARNNPGTLNEKEWKEIICDELSERPKNIDELCISLGIPFSYLSALVAELETAGRIEDDRGKYVLTIRRR